MGKYIKTFYFDYKSCLLGTMQFSSWAWVEGVGSEWELYSLIMETMPLGVLDFVYMCYNDTANYRYPLLDSSVNTCPLWLGDNEVEQATKVVIYPNPSFSTVTISVEQYNNASLTIQLYDRWGRKVLQKNFVNAIELQLDG